LSICGRLVAQTYSTNRRARRSTLSCILHSAWQSGKICGDDAQGNSAHHAGVRIDARIARSLCDQRRLSHGGEGHFPFRDRIGDYINDPWCILCTRCIPGLVSLVAARASPCGRRFLLFHHSVLHLLASILHADRAGTLSSDLLPARLLRWLSHDLIRAESTGLCAASAATSEFKYLKVGPRGDKPIEEAVSLASLASRLACSASDVFLLRFILRI